MNGLDIRDVHKTYPNGVEVLKGIDIEVDAGQFLILVGSSGCGKSTLLNMIAGLEPISRGEIRIGGRVVNDLPPKSRDIAMVFQSYALYPSMTVRQNISFGLEVRGVSAAEQKRAVDRVAEMLQIGHLLERKPKQLSGGQRQRVAMGRAMARDPVLFLFDEPLSNLDAQLRLEMRAEIKLMHRRLGKTICYVTHDQIEAMTLGDRIAVMKDGVVQQFGPPQEVYDSPANMYVAGFIGAPPMNFIRGTVATARDRAVFECVTPTGKVSLPLPFGRDAVSAPDGAELLLGLRPERMTDLAKARYEDAAGASARVDVRVDVVEPTGPDNLVVTELGGNRVVCRVHSSCTAVAGELLPLTLDLSKAVLFDPRTGARVDAHKAVAP